MPTNVKELKPIPPNPPRWKPNTDPASINVAGLDTMASVNDQIDQIDQLITLKLQDIDADFSKMQHVLSSRILPAFKRYAIGTEPVREAAKFWTSFYEHAAQVRISTSDDPSSMQEASPGVATDEHHSSSLPEDSLITPESSADTFDPNRTPSESSFLPAHAAVSSTPAAATARARGANDTSSASIPPPTEPSWGMSFESPLVRLNRDLREFARADPQPASSSASMDLHSEVDITIGNARTITADETVQGPVLAPASSNTRVSRTTEPTPVAPPPSLRRNPATPARNPYLPAHTKPRDWSGIVDLRSPQLATPSVTDKEEDLTLPAGMSPPVMVPFATLPTLGRSPAKNAAAKIRHALVRDVLRANGGDPSVSASGSGHSMPTPPSLSRYTRDSSRSHSGASIEPELHPQHWWQSSGISTSGSSTSILDNKSLSTPSYYTTPAPAPAYAHEAVPEPLETPLPLAAPSGVASLVASGGSAAATDATPVNAAATESDDGSMSTFSSSGEDDSMHNTAHPSAAFLLASRQRGRHDYDDDHDDSPDDGGDDFDDSLLDADVDAAAARAPVHPFARARAQAAAHGGDAGDYDDYDDSFDSFDSGGGGGGDQGDAQPEETVFGIRPADGEAAQPQLRMLGEHVLQSQDTTRIRTRLPWVGHVEESPTPWGDGSRGRGG